MDVVQFDYDISRQQAFADLRGIVWRLIEEMVAFDPTEIPEEVEDFEILNPCSFLQSLTRDPSVGRRVPPHRRTPMTFADFTKNLFELYIVREVMKRFQEAQASLGNFVEEQQIMWQNEMVSNANLLMKKELVEYQKLVLSDQMIQAQL